MDRTRKYVAQPPVTADITVINDGVVEVISGQVIEFENDGCLIKMGKEFPIDSDFEMRIQNMDRRVFDRFSPVNARFDSEVDFAARARVFSSRRDEADPKVWITEVKFRGSIRIARNSKDEGGDAR